MFGLYNQIGNGIHLLIYIFDRQTKRMNEMEKKIRTRPVDRESKNPNLIWSILNETKANVIFLNFLFTIFVVVLLFYFFYFGLYSVFGLWPGF